MSHPEHRREAPVVLRTVCREGKLRAGGLFLSPELGNAAALDAIMLLPKAPPQVWHSASGGQPAFRAGNYYLAGFSRVPGGVSLEGAVFGKKRSTARCMVYMRYCGPSCTRMPLEWSGAMMGFPAYFVQ